MQMHASCVVRGDAGVLLLGPSGSGKSDLALRLVDQGFMLVADDRVDIARGIARPPARLAGLLEVRGLGIFHLPYRRSAPLALVVELGAAGPRLPWPTRHPALGVTRVRIDPSVASAVRRVVLALDAVLCAAPDAALCRVGAVEIGAAESREPMPIGAQPA